MSAYDIIFPTILAGLCLTEFFINFAVIYAIFKGRLWRQNSTYALSLGNLLNDQFLLVVHMVYLVPALYLKSYLVTDWPRGLFPSVINWGLLAGWYMTSFTLAYVALTRFIVIVLNWANISYSLAFFSMLLIATVSWAMSVVAQFIFPCCQMVMDPFNYGYGYVQIGNLSNTSNAYFDFPLNNAVSGITIGCYTLIVLKLVYMRQRHHVRTNQIKGAKEYTYALQFSAISCFYVFNWVSTRVNPYIFGSNIEWYSCGVFFLIFNCGANGVIYIWRNREVRRVLFRSSGPGRTAATVSVPAQTTSEIIVNPRKPN